MTHAHNKHDHEKHAFTGDRLSFAQLGVTARLLVALALSGLVWVAIATVML